MASLRFWCGGLLRHGISPSLPGLLLGGLDHPRGYAAQLVFTHLPKLPQGTRFDKLMQNSMDNKEFFIRALRLIDVDDNTNIPTVLYYGPDSRVLIGSAAMAAAADKHELLNEDFKVDLGNINPTSKAIRDKFDT